MHGRVLTITGGNDGMGVCRPRIAAPAGTVSEQGSGLCFSLVRMWSVWFRKRLCLLLWHVGRVGQILDSIASFTRTQLRNFLGQRERRAAA